MKPSALGGNDCLILERHREGVRPFDRLRANGLQAAKFFTCHCEGQIFLSVIARGFTPKQSLFQTVFNGFMDVIIFGRT